jgi:hypothetical protein
MLKKSISLITALILIIMPMVTANGVGSPDVECQRYGFDYGIVKYECSDGFEEGSYYDYYNISVEWNECDSFDYTSDPAVDGILLKASTETTVFPGDGNGTITKPDKYDISHITFCGYEPPVVPEFGLLVGTLTVASAITVFFLIRRR